MHQDAAVTSASLWLRVLGPVTVRRAGDPPEVSLVTQPRHVALLCYLALARPRGLHARDSIIALLWPEHDAQRGRRALRNALHGLRQLLGPNLIVAAGDGLVGLDPSQLQCDALELERTPMLASLGNEADLGEPFEGFHVDEAAPFDWWLSRERDRLNALRQNRANSDVVVTRPRTRTLHTTPTPARSDGVDPYSLFIRGNFLFLRSAHGGAPDELLQSRVLFERALALDESYAPALAGLSNFFAVAARRELLTPFHHWFAQAIAYSYRALEADPTLAIPHVHLAVEAMYLRDELDRAGEHFEMAVSNDPSYAEGHRFYGVWLTLMQRHDDALRAMETAAALEPDIPHIQSSLAAARIAVGDDAGGESALRQTLMLDAKHGPARERLLRLFERQERFDEAIAERLRDPTLDGAADFADAWRSNGATGYRQAREEEVARAIAILEPRILARAPTTVSDIYAPPVVRLIALYAQLGAWKKVRSWQLQACAERPALAHWIASLPELQRAHGRL
jgi:tetratricopeptide (TPR) repeat protein